MGFAKSPVQGKLNVTHTVPPNADGLPPHGLAPSDIEKTRNKEEIDR